MITEYFWQNLKIKKKLEDEVFNEKVKKPIYINANKNAILESEMNHCSFFRAIFYETHFQHKSFEIYMAMLL